MRREVIAVILVLALWAGAVLWTRPRPDPVDRLQEQFEEIARVTAKLEAQTDRIAEQTAEVERLTGELADWLESGR